MHKALHLGREVGKRRKSKYWHLVSKGLAELNYSLFPAESSHDTNDFPVRSDSFCLC